MPWLWLHVNLLTSTAWDASVWHIGCKVLCLGSNTNGIVATMLKLLCWNTQPRFTHLNLLYARVSFNVDNLDVILKGLWVIGCVWLILSQLHIVLHFFHACQWTVQLVQFYSWLITIFSTLNSNWPCSCARSYNIKTNYFLIFETAQVIL